MICTTLLAGQSLAAEQGLAGGWIPPWLGWRRQLWFAMTFNCSPKTTDTPRQGHSVHFLGAGPVFMVSGPQVCLNLGMEASPPLSAVQSKPCPQMHFAFIKIKKVKALHALVLAETKAFSQKIQVHWALEKNDNFVTHAWALGSNCIFYHLTFCSEHHFCWFTVLVTQFFLFLLIKIFSKYSQTW